MSKKDKTPPEIARWLLEKISRRNERFSIVGDFEEIYKEIAMEKGVTKALYWYWNQIIRSVLLFILNSLYWSTAMFKNYLKVSIRNIIRYKLFSFINIFGLSVGIAFSILIFLFVRNEYSFDSFHEHSDSLYRIWQVIQEPGKPEDVNATTPIHLAEVLKETFQEIVEATRYSGYETMVSNGEKSFSENVYLTDPGFFHMFSFPIIKGNTENPLRDINAIVITEKASQKYFGDSDPVGDVLTVQMQDTRIDFTVTAVVENLPKNSSLQFGFIIHIDWIKEIVDSPWLTSWGLNIPQTYIQLPTNVKSTDFEKKLAVIAERYKESYPEAGTRIEVMLQPLTDIHLSTEVPPGNLPVSNPAYSYILSGLGLLVLFIACINFTTLTLGRSTNRAKEVGIRKVVGAFKSQLTKQYIGEAILLGFLSLLMGIIITIFVLPLFNELSGKELSFSLDLSLILMFIMLVLVVGITAGSYPAVVLSRFQPALVLKGFQKVKGKNWLSKGLVILQFSLSIFLIVATLLMREQMQFLKEKDLGFDRERIVALNMNAAPETVEQTFQNFKNELKGNSEIISVSAACHPFGINWTRIGYEQPGGTYLELYYNRVDYDYLETMGIELVEGRNFSEEFSTDYEEAIIVNESLVKHFGWDDPVSRKLPGTFRSNHKIIGVVKDFHYSSLHEEIQPLVISLSFRPVIEETMSVSTSTWPPILYYALIRLNKGETAPLIKLIENKWKKIAPHTPFDITFVDDTINAQYIEDQRWSKIINSASVMAIVIACLGLLGLTTIAVEKRVKEIGIRKVLGASLVNITGLISKELLVPVALANIIAWPAAYFVLNRWLQGFAYRVNPGILSFLISLLVVVAIALITMSFQSVKAALANPVEVLKNE